MKQNRTTLNRLFHPPRRVAIAGRPRGLGTKTLRLGKVARRVGAAVLVISLTTLPVTATAGKIPVPVKIGEPGGQADEAPAPRPVLSLPPIPARVGVTIPKEGSSTQPAPTRLQPPYLIRPSSQPMLPPGQAPVPRRVSHSGSHVIHLVGPGENLWMVAATYTPPGPGQLEKTWRRIIRANQDQFATGGPHLIFPGQRLKIPARD